MELSENLGDRYCEYLTEVSPELDVDILQYVEQIIGGTHWQQPQSASDWNNLAVIYLTESNLPSALNCLEKGFAISQDPLCAAHYAIVQVMIGETEKATNLAFSTLIGTMQRRHTQPPTPAGLIYLPLRVKHPQELALILQTANGFDQALMVLAEVLWRAALVFYNAVGMRSLSIGCDIFPTSPSFNLMLGLANLMGNRSEGIINLHMAQQLAPDHPAILQALYLGYLTLGNREAAIYWLEQAAQFQGELGWAWTDLPLDSKFTYVPFETDLILAVEPDLHSIVTSILLGQQDWFEDEMEFWRSFIQPGMTVIDVGANAGVYTFSAAKRVGADGKVIAIEPFSKCVSYLKQTCAVNNLTPVKILAAAASDRQGSIKLGISAASELNQIITEAEAVNSKFEEVVAITLDSLITTENLQRVDILKVDAEGHEISVFQGAVQLLKQFAPVIMYENVAGGNQNSLPVAEFLQERGYELFKYKPHIQQLLPLDLNITTSLNIIAIKKT